MSSVWHTGRETLLQNRLPLLVRTLTKSKSLATGVLGCHWLDSGKETIAQVLKLPTEDMVQKHRTDYDAAYQALVLKGLLEKYRGVKTETIPQI